MFTAITPFNFAEYAISDNHTVHSWLCSRISATNEVPYSDEYPPEARTAAARNSKKAAEMSSTWIQGVLPTRGH